MPSGSSLTKFAAVTSPSRVCVHLCWGCSAVAKGEEVMDSLGVLQVGKGFPPSLPNPPRLSAGARLCRDPAVLVAGSSGARERLSSPLNPAPKHQPLGFFHLHSGHWPGTGLVTDS